ncbi:alpha/beta hydrolase [Alcaligenaceae bacterium CGII-47]|nr:alpha/beta hydrolase [Alcaligenaceae bacterium CGII-47]
MKQILPTKNVSTSPDGDFMSTTRRSSLASGAAKALSISGLVLLVVLLGCWLMVRSWTVTPYGKLDTRTAIILKLANLTDKSGPVSTPAEMRATDEKLNKLLGGEKTPVNRVINQDIPGPAGTIPVRIYVPESSGPLPVVLYFHGGGWVNGSLETHDNTSRKITRYGNVIVVAVDYRRAPEHPFPAPVQDCYAALEWASLHAADFGGDGTRLGVAGDSAGGNLAAVIALMARDRKGPKISAQVLIYPATNIATMDTESHKNFATGYLLTSAELERFRDLYTLNPEDRTKPEVSPLLAEDLSGLPSALVITAEFDPLRDEGEAYADRLDKAGVKTTAKRYPGVVHGFIAAPRLLPQAELGTAEVGAFLQQELKQP